MRQPSPRRWHPRRLAPTWPAATPDAIAHRMAPPPPRPTPAVPAELKAEAPGPDGVRHALVAHVRRLIAAGAYDTPDRWAAAEARLVKAAEGR